MIYVVCFLWFVIGFCGVSVDQVVEGCVCSFYFVRFLLC